ncbi:LLM class flavin-dependent oxidoreductase [Gulosibacter macacae]|uniref:LLM class flavin-dependent oxidoreductase n=1 Tax=Gulosibacter macacae TaxID=2488791 RepID=A0A3P3VUY3_9MICO|nr:LLM class flavin-dependent oxidoreductase [Gulosibacter macacae]RRJ86622.1 LLM class flavin-dependent oxidoreductase [Gulosibacter macacae]
MTLLSVLDLIPLASGQSTHDALGASRELAQAADRLGYHRLWLAEHHNTEAIASTSPPVALAWLGAATERIRLGSGGVMLPNHAPYVVAEQFALLEGMFPGRVDLGLGRAPGTDPITAQALRRDPTHQAVHDYPRNVLEILGYLGDVRDQHDPEYLRRIRAAADIAHLPEVWLLGSSMYSAELAGALGMRYAFANHFAMGTDPVAVFEHYRRSFEPSPTLDAPYAMVSAGALVGETHEDALRLDLPQRVWRYELVAGKIGPVKSPAEAAAFAQQVGESDIWRRARGHEFVGTAEVVRTGLERLVERTGADELMLSVSAHDVADRIATLEALAP